MANQWCVMLMPQIEGTQRAAALAAAKWDEGTTIRIAFMEGEKSLQDRVKAVAETWLSKSGVNLEFSWLQDPSEADVRIAFRQGGGSWSVLGKYCLDVEKSKPTMNYGWLTPGSSDLAVQEVVLHEFGHALGLIHEHQNPTGGIVWNEEEVIRELSGPPNNWNEAKIRFNVLDQPDPRDIIGTPFDPDSIMLYHFPVEWTRNGVSTKSNSELSDKDIQLLRRLYP